MLSEKAISGLLNASPEKRYKSFLNTIVDIEELWFMRLESEHREAGKEGLYAALWPCEEVLRGYNIKNENPTTMEIHEFLQLCKEQDKTIHFVVFPTDKDSWVVTCEQLYQDIIEHLEEIE